MCAGIPCLFGFFFNFITIFYYALLSNQHLFIFRFQIPCSTLCMVHKQNRNTAKYMLSNFIPIVSITVIIKDSQTTKFQNKKSNRFLALKVLWILMSRILLNFQFGIRFIKKYF